MQMDHRVRDIGMPEQVLYEAKQPLRGPDWQSDGSS
jgi:hypothetical protein